MRITAAFCALLALLGVFAAAAAAGPAQPQVVGGADVPDPNPYTWQVSIGSGGDPYGGHRCGGSLIAARWVLSAGHCFSPGELMNPSGLHVVLGARTLSAALPEQLRGVRQVLVHPEFQAATLANDIALVELDAPAPAGAAILALSSPADDRALSAPGALATLTGWGGLLGYDAGEWGPPGGQVYPDTLQVVELPVLAAAACGPVDPLFDDARQICAGYPEGGRDGCQGDSGGALVVPDSWAGFRQIGIVSSGVGCAAPGYPGTYTRVAAFDGWVQAALAAAPLSPRLFLPLVTTSG